MTQPETGLDAPVDGLRKFHFGAGGEGNKDEGGARKFVKLAQTAEEYGYDTFAVPDHLGNQVGPIAALGALPPDVEPRATDHIDAMKAMIETLVDKGNAYVADGHVLFHTPSMPEYGALSGRSLDEMIAGARVEVASYKKDPTDFVLWKPSTMEEPGWSSPASTIPASGPAANWPAVR